MPNPISLVTRYGKHEIIETRELRPNRIAYGTGFSVAGPMKDLTVKIVVDWMKGACSPWRNKEKNFQISAGKHAYEWLVEHAEEIQSGINEWERECWTRAQQELQREEVFNG